MASLSSAEPKYQALYSSFVEEIRTGQWPSGQKLDSERELAQRYSVSRATIREAMNRLESAGYIVRVQGAGTFVNGRSHAVPELMQNVVSCIFPHNIELAYHDPFLQPVMAGVNSCLAENGMRMLLCPLDSPLALETLFPREDVGSYFGSGCLYLGSTMPEEVVRAFRDSGVPLVTVGRPAGEILCDYVDVDHVEAMSNVVTHLLAQGHREIKFLNFYEDTSNFLIDECEGFRQAFHRAGLPEPADFIIRVNANSDDAAQIAMEKWLADSPTATALVTQGDHMTKGALRALRGKGLGVPQDMALLSYGDMEFMVDIEPSITAVRQPFVRMGREAARLLQKRILQPTKPVENTILDAELIVRESSVCSRMS